MVPIWNFQTVSGRDILRSSLAHRFMLYSSVVARVWTGQGYLPGFHSFPLRVFPAPTALIHQPLRTWPSSELRIDGVLGSSQRAPGQLAGWWRTRPNFLPQARWVAYCGTVATRILLS